MTLERIELDETAVGTMGIEWTSQPALSRAEEECAIAVESGERGAAAYWAVDGREPIGDEQMASGRAEFGADRRSWLKAA
jgi:hypothetical protein